MNSLRYLLRQVRCLIFGRPKGIIKGVGTITPDGILTDWHFDGKGTVPGIEITRAGKVYYCGYSVEELRGRVDENK